MKRKISSYWIRSALYAFFQRFSLTIFGLANFMILIRSLSKEQMGIWALFLAITSIFEAAKSNLLKNAHIRFVSSAGSLREKTAIASSSFVINLAVTILFILIIVLFAHQLNSLFKADAELEMMLKWYIPGLIGMVFFSHLEAVQQSHLDFKGNFIGYFIRQFSFFSFIVIHKLSDNPFSLSALAQYQSLSIFLGTVLLFFFSRKYLYYHLNITRKSLKDIFGYGGYIFSSGIIASILANIDQLIVGSFLSPASVAYYNAASRINGLVDIPSYAASEIIFPKLSKASVDEGIAKVKYLYEKMVAVLLSFTTPTAVFIILFPKFVIDIVAGDEYAIAAPILQLYMITGLARPMQNQAANLLNSIGKPGLCFVLNAITLAANVLINYFCLLYIGFYGAAIGTLVTSIIGSIIWYFVMRKQIGAGLASIIKYMIDFYKLYFNQAIIILSGKKIIRS